MVNEGGALESIIPFDAPKHPRLPYNQFPKGGRTGALTKALQVAWISGKYLYKYRKKWLAVGLALSVSASTLFQNPNAPKNVPNKFNQTRNRRGRNGYRGRVKQGYNCKCGSKRRRYNFRSRKRSRRF